uniref:AlNc14C29G2742 protein n=1 Tax=Albugo laibachii Nc14 TaxID=890382 RepID=F0W7C2_9STRA|nr:AlNc14C29G2742 [Albugo laibachii Nc14]|eukprot:CCA17021.1 AlNc14C29G2742 [Albugo laibachii Nc14]
MGPPKIPPVKTIEDSEGEDESKMDQMMKLLQTLGNRLDELEVECSVIPPVPVLPKRGESVFEARINEVQGLKKSSLDASPMQQRGNRMGQSFDQTMHGRTHWSEFSDFKGREACNSAIRRNGSLLGTWTAIYPEKTSFFVATVIRTASFG